ncbi:MAG: cyclic nucleotide-binding domain-containing protein [Magnetococcales bacterium]|nr:cyclic nucleotide-binding domain-containing protein [Magnetococcales bacterium]
MRMRRQCDHVLEFLKQNYRPFSEFAVPTLIQSQEYLRILKLQRGEHVTLRGFGETPDYFYVIQGQVLLITPHGERRVDALADLSLLSFLTGGETYTTIHALTDSLICHANSSKIDELITWDQVAKKTGFFDTGDASEPSLRSLMESKAFRKLPIEAVEEVFRRMTRVPVTGGTDVVVQGERGDAFYLIVNGRAEVWRKGIYDKEQQCVTTLGKGDVFGEEALILGGNRNATVRMRETGLLLRLSKPDFDELIATPNIRSVPASVAKTMLENGYRLLDVRYQEEYEERYVPGAQLIPLPDLRARLPEIDPREKYLVLCAAGKRAAVGVLLLRQHHVQEAIVVEGGLRDWPYETASMEEIF